MDFNNIHSQRSHKFLVPDAIMVQYSHNILVRGAVKAILKLAVKSGPAQFLGAQSAYCPLFQQLLVGKIQVNRVQASSKQY